MPTGVYKRGSFVSKVRIGFTSGWLTVIEYIEKLRGHHYWLTSCLCGGLKRASATNLLNGSVHNCGCRTCSLRSLAKTKHGMCRTRVYKIWRGMKDRCADLDNPYYGGRGITVCPKWIDSFEAFYDYMGTPPEGMSIDRFPDNNGNYEPGNVRWATQRDQTNNTRATILLTARGRTMPLSYWADETGVDRVLLWIRVFRLGWSHEDAIFKPVKHQQVI